jgi:phage RecT family recombinase
MEKALTRFDNALADRRIVSQFNASRFDRDLKWSAEKQYAIAAIRSNEALQRADPESLRMALLDVAFSGLSLAPMKGHGYLIPYEGQVKFSPGYRGLLHLVHRAKTIKSVQPGVVHLNDKFRVYTRDNVRIVDHELAMKNRGPATHVYVIAHFTNGGQHVEVMDQSELKACEEAATKRNAKGGAVWRSGFRDQMEIKACMRRAWKWWPQDAEGEIEHAMTVVNKADPVDFSAAPDPEPGRKTEAEICLSDTQVLELHAFLTDREVQDPDKWLANLANALGAKTLSLIPARRFDEAKQRLKDRYEVWREKHPVAAA